MMKISQTLVIVDCEAAGPTPYNGDLTEFAAIEFNSRDIFYGRLWDTDPDPVTPAIPVIRENSAIYDQRKIFTDFRDWAMSFEKSPKFVSDNPAYDFMWIADGFARAQLDNPFGFSARRIGDLAAGLSGNWKNTNSWKRHRRTPHDHDPRNDVKGNAEALEFILSKYNQS